MRPSQQQLVTGMDADASARGAIVVYPEGVGGTWQAGVCCNDAGEDIDDVGFTAALLDVLEATFCVDVDRVYATGLSNGGFMAHHLACRLADRITAIAAVSGPEGSPGCNPGRAVPVLHIHGTADNVVPYNGYGGFVSAPATFDGWAERNGCATTTTTTYQRGDVRCERRDGCAAPVELCTIEGGGHQWPGGMTIPGLGDNTRDLDANAAILDFFDL
jgi:polyhydroxybutyrate depolymerase